MNTEIKEKRRPRSYKATDTDYNAAVRAAVMNNTSLAAEIEKYIKTYKVKNKKK